VHGIIGDFVAHLDWVPEAEGCRLVAFLGGTLGNFAPGERRRFLRGLAALLGPRDHLLIGHDLVKEPSVIEAAYNDSAGLTAEFNKHILDVLNRRLDADFDLASFDHVAFFDTRHNWIEMRLRATREMNVRLDRIDLEIHFDEGEEVRTEISTKFTRGGLRSEFAAAGLEFEDLLTDPKDLYGLSLSRLANDT
jgi:L-histidine N-alpha-methyltransferase